MESSVFTPITQIIMRVALVERLTLILSLIFYIILTFFTLCVKLMANGCSNLCPNNVIYIPSYNFLQILAKGRETFFALYGAGH